MQVLQSYQDTTDHSRQFIPYLVGEGKQSVRIDGGRSTTEGPDGGEVVLAPLLSLNQVADQVWHNRCKCDLPQDNEGQLRIFFVYAIVYCIEGTVYHQDSPSLVDTEATSEMYHSVAHDH